MHVRILRTFALNGWRAALVRWERSLHGAASGSRSPADQADMNKEWPIC